MHRAPTSESPARPGADSRGHASRRPNSPALQLIQGLFLLLLLIASAPRSQGHAANESYLVITIDGTNVSGRLDISRRDLQQGIRVGLAASGAAPAALESLPADELLRREETYALDLVAGLQVTLDGQPVPLEATDFTTLPLNNGDYARTLFAAAPLSGPPTSLQVNCRALFRIAPTMHGLLRIEHNDRTEAVAYTVESPTHTFTLAAPSGAWSRWATFITEGIRHIWIGLDHILFLLALLLPAVFRDGPGGRTGVDRFQPAFLNVVRVVTAFTVAHSITLSLATFGWIPLPGRYIEAIVAASVVVAAANNLKPWFRDRSWLVAFAFGLIHGFGFASALGDLGLVRSSLAAALIGFNVGIELGQIAIVLIFLPAAFALRDTWFYRVLTVKVGSACVIVIASLWMFERLLDRRILGL